MFSINFNYNFPAIISNVMRSCERKFNEEQKACFFLHSNKIKSERDIRIEIENLCKILVRHSNGVEEILMNNFLRKQMSFWPKASVRVLVHHLLVNGSRFAREKKHQPKEDK